MLNNIFNVLSNVGATKMVLVVRTDLKIGTGKIATQCAHAAVNLYDSALQNKSSVVQSWFRFGQKKVVLRIDINCVEEMNELYNKAIQENLNACLVYDSGKTEIEGGTLTVLGIGPNYVKDVDKITGHLKLL